MRPNNSANGINNRLSPLRLGETRDSYLPDLTNKLENFMQQIQTPENSLENSITQLKTNLIINTNLTTNTDLQGYRLTSLQTHGAILAYITTNGEMPQNITILNIFLEQANIIPSAPQEHDDILDSFLGLDFVHRSDYSLAIDYETLRNEAQLAYQDISLNYISSGKPNMDKAISLLRNIIAKFTPYSTNTTLPTNLNARFVANINQILQTFPEELRAIIAGELIKKVYITHGVNSRMNRNRSSAIGIIYERQIHLLLSNNISDINQIIELIYDIYMHNPYDFSFIVFSQNNNTILSLLEYLPRERVATILDRIIISNRFNTYQLHNLISRNQAWLGNGLYSITVERIAQMALQDPLIFNMHPNFLTILLSERSYLPPQILQELNIINRLNMIHNAMDESDEEEPQIFSRSRNQG